MKEIKKIVITGGPCAGKTTSVKFIRERYEALGYGVLVADEAATELLRGGITPASVSRITFQHAVFKMQLFKEALYASAARDMEQDRVLILFDRGVLDGRAYLTESEYSAMLKEEKIAAPSLNNRYDAVFYLETSARADRGFYNKKNNNMRMEDAEEAILIDDRIKAAWAGCINLNIIPAASDMADKLSRLSAAFSLILPD